MKSLFFLVVFLTLNVQVYGQLAPLQDSEVCARYRKIVSLIKAKNAKALSKLIDYPIPRHYPLPTIRSSKDFIHKFDEIFDTAFITKLHLHYTDSVIFERYGSYGLVGEGGFAGDIWMEHDGRIRSINYISKIAENERQRLKDSIKQQMHVSIRNWEESYVEGATKKYCIRVDWTGDSLRYACWNNGRTQKEKPDLIIVGGESEAQGTMGGWTWTFKNKEWTYIVDQRDMCESPEDCGTFLIIMKNNKEQYSAKLKLQAR